MTVERSAPASVWGKPLPELPAGHLLDQFRIVGRLGRGGMGVVYEAEDTLLNRRVAIKTLPTADPTARPLLREAQAAAKLDHPNVIRVLHVGAWPGGNYLVLELARGGSLLDRVRGGPLPWDVATRYAADAARGLAAAHAAGLVHRDIKPANLMLDEGGTVKVTDFGLVRGMDLSASTAGHVVGTPHFMSPEQCRGEPADARSDVYALGATYYALLTGESPFPAPTPVQVMFAHCTHPAPDPGVEVSGLPPGCAYIVQRAMAKHPADRFQSAHEMFAALVALLTPGALVPFPVPAAPRALAPAAPQAPRVLVPVAVDVPTPSPLDFEAAARPRPLLLAAPSRARAAARGGSGWRTVALAALALVLLIGGGVAALRLTRPRAEESARADGEKKVPAPADEKSTRPPVPNPNPVPKSPPPGGERKIDTRAPVTPPVTPEVEPPVVTPPKIEPPLEVAPAPRLVEGPPDLGPRPIVAKAVPPRQTFKAAGPVRALDFSRDGELLAAGGTGGATVWEPKTGKVVKRLNWGEVLTVAFADYPKAPESRGGLFGGATRGAGHEWNRKTDAQGPFITDWNPPVGGISAVAGGPGGLVAVGYAGINLDGQVRVYDPATGGQLVALNEGRGSATVQLAFSPDPTARLLASADERGRVFLWQYTNEAQPKWQALKEVPTPGGKRAVVAFPPKKTTVLVAAGDEIRFWNCVDGKDDGEAMRLVLGKGPNGPPILALAVSPDGKWCAAGDADGTVTMCNLATRKPVKTIAGTTPVRAVAFSPDGRRLAAAGDDGTVRLWDVPPLVAK